eukprot:TRINITY_DN389_c0_g1_i1.p1 TRINITY_DN389_c0_g1~~TRINITY_DN389_c0_g1_i1.p1  ORF type:complete len:251 (-),score=33.39 TRINITY_DN389_c0_g1_i1:157-909(-)
MGSIEGVSTRVEQEEKGEAKLVPISRELPPPLVATHEMSFYCFYVLKKHFKRHKNDLLNGINKNSKKRKNRPHSYVIPEAQCALFVGWKIDSEHGERLRGCKGTHSVLPLEEGLRHYALISAFDDRRFSMMREEEVPTLSCSISLLHRFEEADDINDWEIGVHGLKIEFEDSKNKFRSATFLPSVMTQFGYNKRQTIKRLIEKSGSKDKLTKSLGAKIKTIRFQASEIKTHHSEWENKLSSMNNKSKRAK